MSGNPLIPPIGEALAQTLSPDEITTFSAYLRPLVETGTGTKRRALAHLTATKLSPGSA
jgi:hypothetical protein